MNEPVTLTKQQVHDLWVMVWHGGTLGERLPIAMKILGDVPEFIHDMDTQCPLCGTTKDEDDE